MFINTESKLATEPLPEDDAPPARQNPQHTLPVSLSCGLQVMTTLQLQHVDSRLAYRDQQRVDVKQRTQRHALLPMTEVSSGTVSIRSEDCSCRGDLLPVSAGDTKSLLRRKH